MPSDTLLIAIIAIILPLTTFLLNRRDLQKLQPSQIAATVSAAASSAATAAAADAMTYVELGARQNKTIADMMARQSATDGELAALHRQINEAENKIGRQDLKIARQEAKIDEQALKIEEQKAQLAEVSVNLKESRALVEEQKKLIDGMPGRIDKLEGLLKAAGIPVEKDREIDTARAAIDDKEDAGAALKAPDVPSQQS